MSSVHRAPSQIPARIKYLLLTAVDEYAMPAAAPAAAAASATDLQLSNTSVYSASSYDFYNSVNGTTAAAGLYRDLGVELHFQINGVAFATYRLAQPCNGSTSEGVSATAPADNVFVLVWSASSEFGVPVAVRTG